MASSPSTSPGPPQGPNSAFRQLRGGLSPGEFASAVRRAAREIGERVCCDARYVGRVEAGEIRCPNYAYERVFLHMFPGRTLGDMGFAPRESVRGRAARPQGAYGGEDVPPSTPTRRTQPVRAAERPTPGDRISRTSRTTGPVHHEFEIQQQYETPPQYESDEESDVLRRAFMTGGPAALVAVSLTGAAAPGAHAAGAGTPAHPGRPTGPAPVPTQIGEPEVAAVERAVRRIRLLDDRHGADDLYPRACESLRAAYELLDVGARRRSVADRLHTGAGELALSVGWLAHDSCRFADARSHYAEALATARLADDPAVEAHAFCNTAFLARDAGRPREAVCAAQAGARAAARLGSARLLSLLALREAGGWAGMGDRTACGTALGRAHALYARGPSDADPGWMTFFGEAELAGLEAQCWSALGDWDAAAEQARRAVALQQPHFVRNRALFTAELAGDLAARRRPDEAAAAATDALALLGPVRSARIRGMLGTAARRLEPYRDEPRVADFLRRPRPSLENGGGPPGNPPAAEGR